MHRWVSAEQKLTLSQRSTAVVTNGITIAVDDLKDFFVLDGVTALKRTNICLDYNCAVFALNKITCLTPYSALTAPFSNTPQALVSMF